MTAITAPHVARLSTTLWERVLLDMSHRLEGIAVHHMRRRAVAARREPFVQATAERQRDARAEGALRMYGR